MCEFGYQAKHPVERLLVRIDFVWPPAALNQRYEFNFVEQLLSFLSTYSVDSGYIRIYESGPQLVKRVEPRGKDN